MLFTFKIGINDRHCSALSHESFSNSQESAISFELQRPSRNSARTFARVRPGVAGRIELAREIELEGTSGRR